MARIGLPRTRTLASRNHPTRLSNARFLTGQTPLSQFGISRRLGVPCNAGGAAARPRTSPGAIR
eukprot:11132909-Alexandrium_andersonii.AAC.1